MMKGLYSNLGYAKSEELAKKSWSFWHLLELDLEGRKSAQTGGTVREGIARDFIREFLPPGFGLKSGLIFDSEIKRMSPQIDAIMYTGVPLLEFTDAAVVEKQQVKAIFEIKSVIYQNNIFGSKSKGIRNPNTGLISAFKERKSFLPVSGKYVLFAFELHSGSSDKEVSKRLKEICDMYAIVIRREPEIERRAGKENREANFNGSIGKLIEWLRNLK